MNLGLNTLTAALLESGKRVLMCPPGPGQSVGAKVAIAWNGSGEAARAMTAALPVLRKADAVTILASADRELPISGEDAVSYLASPGVSCSVHGSQRGPESVPASLLSPAKKVGPCCPLLGPSGHTRAPRSKPAGG